MIILKGLYVIIEFWEYEVIDSVSERLIIYFYESYFLSWSWRLSSSLFKKVMEDVGRSGGRCVDVWMEKERVYLGNGSW